jgi:hypothetical protein
MGEPIDEATEAFLRAVAFDLQRQIGSRGTVRAVTLEPADHDVTILASIAVNTRPVEVRGTGETLVDAHADLYRMAAAGVLAALFTDVVSA